MPVHLLNTPRIYFSYISLDPELQKWDTQCDIHIFCLVSFYGTSTIVGYLMPNPFLYI